MILFSISGNVFSTTLAISSLRAIRCSVSVGVVRALSAMSSYSLRNLWKNVCIYNHNTVVQGDVQMHSAMNALHVYYRAVHALYMYSTYSWLSFWLSCPMRVRSWVMMSEALLASVRIISSQCSSNNPNGTSWKAHVRYTCTCMCIHVHTHDT